MAARDRVGTPWIARTAACAVCVAGILFGAPSSALADTYLDQANKAASASPGTKPAHEALMPALAAMTEPPVQTGWARDDMLTLLMAAPGEDDWKALEAWASEEPQRKALEVLKSITMTDDRYILGFGYGKDAVDPSWIDAELYVGLNDDGLLYSATFPYLKRVGWLVGLAMFESARVAYEGEGEQSLELCTETFRLGLMLTERPFLREMLAGASIMLISLERVRDVMYQFESSFSGDKLKEYADFMGNARVRERRLPVANKLAADQIIDRTYQQRGKVDSVKLAEVMSGARTQERTLQRLSEAAFWDTRATDQADWFDVTDKVKGVWADWEQRWKLTDLYDPIFELPSDFRKMDADSHLVVYYPLNGVDELFDVRTRLLLEIAGTMNAMGCVGFHQTNRTLPPQIASVEPRFVSKLRPDLYNVDRRQPVRKYQQFQYWVPIRDQKWDRRETPHPHEITVAMIDGVRAPSSGGGMVEESSAGLMIPESFVVPLREEAGLNAGFDDANDTVDVAKLRDFILAAIEEMSFTPDRLKRIDATIKRTVESGVTTENFDTTFDSAFAPYANKLVAEFAAAGVDVNELKSLFHEACKALIALPSVQNAIQASNRGDSISSDNARKLLKEFYETILQPTYIDKLTAINKSMRDGSKAAIEAAGGEGLPTTVFKALVDDKQFLLYSVGPDGQDGRARLVGRAGTDLLMWPPVLSLQREAR